MLLTDEFISKYSTRKFPGTDLGNFVYLRTYSRWLDDKNRRERWFETVRRVVEYSMSLYSGHKTGQDLIREAEELYDYIFNLKIFPAGRSLWVGGTKAAQKFPLSNFNCAFRVIDSIEAFSEIFYLLLVGTGVGFRVLSGDVAKLGKFFINTKLINKPYSGVRPENRQEKTTTINTTNGNWLITVGDSKEGWVEALFQYLSLMQFGAHEIEINYDNVRPKGELLKTFGGRASGHDGLAEMFSKIHQTVTAASNGRLAPRDALDIANLIGEAVVVGGVRRTSEIGLFDISDTDTLNAKFGLWEEDSNNYGKTWRSMSNNTIYFNEKPSDVGVLKDIFNLIKNNGEPGFLNAERAKTKRPNFQGINPSLRAGTKILTTGGIFNIEDLDNKIFSVVNMRGEVSLAKCKLSGKNKQLYKITLKGNHIYHCTPEHKWPVIINGSIIKKDTTELSIGDRLPIQRQERLGFGNYGTFDSGFFYGYLCGDGWITKRKDTGAIQIGLILNNEDYNSEIKDKLINYLQKMGSNATFNDTDNQHELNTQINSIANELDSIGFTHKRNGIPKGMWNFVSDEFRAGFINGLFSSDGSVEIVENNGRISLVTAYKQLANDISELLGFYGIKTSILYKHIEHQKFPNGKEYNRTYEMFTIRISDRNSIQHFKNLFGILSPEKNKKLEIISNFVDKGNYENNRNSIEVINIELTDIKEDVWDLGVDDDLHCFQIAHAVTGNCAEILLDNKGVCNLTTINLMSFVDKNGLNVNELQRAMRLAVRIGMRQTNVTLELPEWDKIQKRDRLTGVSVTGYMDALDALGKYSDMEYQHWLLKQLNEIANAEAIIYSKELRIPIPLLVTAVKPEGTISQLPTVSSGVHRSFAPYYIRRVRVTGTDPIAKVMLDLGYPVYPENGTLYKDELITPEKFKALNWSDRINVLDIAKTWVIEFPVKSNAKFKAADEPAEMQFAMYLDFQKYYTDHNTSITITVGEKEWDQLAEMIYNNWDQYIAVSFLAKDSTAYPLMPYEEINENDFNTRLAELSSDRQDLEEILQIYENKQYLVDVNELDPSCATGVCPVR